MPKAEIAERAEQDGRVADAQAGVDDQRPAALGRISHSITYHGLSPRVWAASTYSRVLMSSVRLRTMRKMPGPEASATATKMLRRARADPDHAERIGVEDESGEQPAAGKEGQREPEASWPGCAR